MDVPILIEGKNSLGFMVVGSNIRFYDHAEEALMFNVSPSNNARADWSFRKSMGLGCALLEVEAGLDGNKTFEEPQRTVVRV